MLCTCIFHVISSEVKEMARGRELEREREKESERGSMGMNVQGIK